MGWGLGESFVGRPLLRVGEGSKRHTTWHCKLLGKASWEVGTQPVSHPTHTHPTADLHLLQVRLWQLGRLLPSRLEAHLEAHAVLPVLYAPSWLLTCYASDFPIPVAARVLDLVITDCWAAPMMKAS